MSDIRGGARIGFPRAVFIKAERTRIINTDNNQFG